ncbi:MAG: argininosuccinate lyase [Lachnospiraceae bacterium]|nr:argininosuccinate lyase [Lachnospiraceae bacterium]
MAQLWGGRFTGGTSELFKKLGDSIYFDRRLWREDIEGSIVHAKMLGRQGIISEEDAGKIIEGLSSIREDIESGRLEVAPDGFDRDGERVHYEDVHSFMEAVLTERIGEAGKRLHTGRSRNDQVALDMRLFVRRSCSEVGGSLLELLGVILDIMEKNTNTYMPGFTHLQKAQPVTLAHHFGAYFEMFRRDAERLRDCRRRLNYSPLGSGALAGTTYPLDRAYTASELGFEGPTRNSMDSVSDRDYCIEFLSDLAMVMMHLSRLSEELIIWNSNEYRFVEMDDAYSTGSSIMPQKKNPDVAELIRGKTGRVYGALISLLTTMKGIPLAYDKDMQEDKEPVFDAIDTADGCIRLMSGMLATIRFRKDVMEASATRGFTNATDAADYLVVKGVPFRDAHGIIGRIVLYCIEKGIGIEEMSLEEFKDFSPFFEEDVYEAISLKTCVEKRNTTGAPGMAAMQEEIKACRAFLAADSKA